MNDIHTGSKQGLEGQLGPSILGEVMPELSVKVQVSRVRRWGRHSRQQEQEDTAWHVQRTQRVLLEQGYEQGC